MEDAVAPDEKEQARKNIIKGLNEIDWGTKSMSIRINGLDTHYMYRDVVDVVEQAGERLDLIMIPKVGTAASKRNESLHFGVADYAASMRARTTVIGGVNEHYSVLTDPLEDGSRQVHWGDMWHSAIANMVVAARANGLRPVDGPFGDFSDPEGYRAA